MYQGFEKVTPEKWKSLIHVEEKVEDHYWEADGLNEELLERFIVTNSNDSESSDDDDDDDVNDGFSDADSTSFGSRSESSTNSSDEGKNNTIQKYNFYNKFISLAMDERVFP